MRVVIGTVIVGLMLAALFCLVAPAYAVIFISSDAVAGGGAACTADLGCETFENAYDQTWADSGWDAVHSFISEGFSSVNSSYHDKGTNLSASQDTSWEFSVSNTTMYFEGWVRFQNISGIDIDGDFAQFLQTESILPLWNTKLELYYDNGQSDVCIRAVYRDNFLNVTTSSIVCGITANTAYHFGIVYENDGSDLFEWYWSTTSDLGVAKDSEAIAAARNPERINIGLTTHSGGAGIDIEYDSFAVDTTTFTPVE